LIDAAIDELTPVVGVKAACQAVGRPRSSHYRRRAPRSQPAEKRSRKGQCQPRALSAEERQTVLDTLHEERFVDQAPASVYASLLDEGSYYASISTMYRILREHGEVPGDRRRHATHPAHTKPELVATAANEVWSWDITKLLGPRKWTWYYLYVIIDIFSRYVPGWLLAPREDARLAEQLLAETCFDQNIDYGQLTVHADRGSSMTSKPVALLLADFGVAKSFSRPRVSNDNPFSESQFRTLKYRPDFPERFDSIEHARAFCHTFFAWYNSEHYHSGVGLLRPADVHYGRAPEIIAARQTVLETAYATHPERFVRQPPRPPSLPDQTWINRPDDKENRLSTSPGNVSQKA
jgi:putative transposase